MYHIYISCNEKEVAKIVKNIVGTKSFLCTIRFLLPETFKEFYFHFFRWESLEIILVKEDINDDCMFKAYFPFILAQGNLVLGKDL